MDGLVLNFDAGQDQGLIRASDGKRYSFSGGEWKSASAPRVGDVVDFEVDESRATEIYLVRSDAPPAAAVPPPQTPAAATPPPQAQAAEWQEPAPFPSPGSPFSLASRPGVIFAAVILLGCLLPFISAPFMSWNLLTFPGIVSPAGMAPGDAGMAGIFRLMLFSLYAIPVMATLVIVQELRGQAGPELRISAGIVGLMPAIILILCLLFARLTNYFPAGVAPGTIHPVNLISTVMSIMGVGWIMISAASIALIAVGRGRLPFSTSDIEPDTYSAVDWLLANPRPRSMVLFEIYAFSSLALSALNSFISFSTPIPTYGAFDNGNGNVGDLFIEIGLDLYTASVIFFAARRASLINKCIYQVASILFSYLGFLFIFIYASMPGSRSGISTLLDIIAIGLTIASLYYIFRSDVRNWFLREGQGSAQDDSLDNAATVNPQSSKPEQPAEGEAWVYLREEPPGFFENSALLIHAGRGAALGALLCFILPWLSIWGPEYRIGSVSGASMILGGNETAYLLSVPSLAILLAAILIFASVLLSFVFMDRKLTWTFWAGCGGAALFMLYGVLVQVSSSAPIQTGTQIGFWLAIIGLVAAMIIGWRIDRIGEESDWSE